MCGENEAPDPPPFEGAATEERRVRFVSLGCKVNQYEVQAFREGVLADEKFREVGRRDAADLVVVNSCVVTHKAEAESKAMIRRAARNNPKAMVIATGCLRDETKAALANIPNVRIVAAEDKNQVPVLAGAKAAADVGPASSVRGMRISRFDGRTRAFVKVQDGCALNCSFCIIPTVRGRLRSRGSEDVLAEVEDLVAGGVREIVLTGVHLGHFGRGKGEGQTLAGLLSELASVDELRRIRLSSLESVELRPEVLEVLASSEKFVPHFHLPLQSGADRVLDRMRRRYSVAEFMTGIEELWKRFDRPSISTDLIVGFPGETESDFVESLELMRRAGFSKTHVFSYSDRAGTDAAAMTDKVPEAEIRTRTRRAIELGEKLAWKYGQSFIGSVSEVLVESEADGNLVGTSERYLKVSFPGPAEWRGALVPVRIHEVDSRGDAKGEATPELERTEQMSLSATK